MIIHLLKKWFSKDYRDTAVLKKIAQTENEFEQIFIKISEMYSQGRDCHTYIDMPLKDHRLDGSWLTDNFYFDLYKKDRRLGRIYVGPNIFLEDPPVKWLVFNNELRPKIIFERDAGELTSTDLAHAINAIAPELLKTWFCKGDRMISINIDIPNIEPMIPLPMKEDK